MITPHTDVKYRSAVPRKQICVQPTLQKKKKELGRVSRSERTTARNHTIIASDLRRQREGVRLFCNSYRIRKVLTKRRTPPTFNESEERVTISFRTTVSSERVTRRSYVFLLCRVEKRHKLPDRHSFVKEGGATLLIAYGQLPRQHNVLKVSVRRGGRKMRYH